jgi:hypothetical protein
MANPNIVNVTSIFGQVGYLYPANVTVNTGWTYNGTTTLTGLTPAANTVNRITSITISNITSSAATATVAVGNNSNFAAANLITYSAYQISVPPNATLIAVDKTTSLYITENQSVAVYAGTSNALTFTATFEQIT